MRTRLHLGFQRCCYNLHNKVKCNFPIYTFDDKYCEGCKRRPIQDQSENNISCLPKITIHLPDSNTNQTSLVPYSHFENLFYEPINKFVIKNKCVIGIDPSNQGYIWNIKPPEIGMALDLGLAVEYWEDVISIY